MTIKGMMVPRRTAAVGSAGLARAEAVERLRQIRPAVGDLVEQAAPEPFAALGDRLAAHALVEIPRRIVAQHPQEAALVAAFLHRSKGGAQQTPAGAALLHLGPD